MHAVLHVIAASGGNGAAGGSAVSLLFLVLIGVVFYFMLIRPQQRRARAQRELAQSISVGDEVVTIGGIFGRVQEVDDDAVILEVAPGTSLRFVRSAIARRLVEQEEEESEEEEDQEAGESP
jgi:preprotein translocase subunit YajC